MSKEFAIEVPDSTYEELSRLEPDRLDEVMVGAVREALDTVGDAEAKRESLHARRRGEHRATEELEGLSDAEEKRRELREKIVEGR